MLIGVRLPCTMVIQIPLASNGSIVMTPNKARLVGSRWNWDRSEAVVAVFNFTPVPRTLFKVGVPKGGYWKEILNSDAPLYGGSGQGNYGGVQAAPIGFHGRPYTLLITLPPLAGVVFKHQGES